MYFSRFFRVDEAGNPVNLTASLRVFVEAALAGFRLATADAGGYKSGSRHSRRAYKETDE